MKMKIRGMIGMLSLGVSLGGVQVSHSDETMGEKIGDKVDEVKKDAKINMRKAKRKARNANCTAADRKQGKCGPMEDIKDGAKNVGDEIDHNAKKVKNKID